MALYRFVFPTGIKYLEWTVFTLQSGNSAEYALANFPVGADMQQLRPNSNTRFAINLSKSDFPKTQKEWKEEKLMQI